MAIGVATTCIAVLLSVLSGVVREPPPAETLERLMDGHRPFVVRLTAGTAQEGLHRPCSQPPPLCDPPLRLEDRRLGELAAFTTFLTSEGRRSSGADPVRRAKALHLRGVVALVTAARSGEIGAAVAILEEAAGLAPEAPGVAADLAAAHLVKADLEDDLGARFTALALLDRALESDPSLRGAHFNRALVLERLGLLAEAQEAWLRVREDSKDSGWRGEAQSHLDALSRPSAEDRWQALLAALHSKQPAPGPQIIERMVMDHPQQVRLYVEDVLLPSWGRALEGGDRTTASRSLELARRLAKALEPVGNGTTLLGTLESLSRASPQTAPLLARAFRLYGEGRAAHEAGDYTAASGLLGESASILQDHGSPFAAWPRFYLAVRRNYSEPLDLEKAADGHRDVLNGYGDGEPVIRAYAHWMLGYTMMFRGHWAEAIEHYEEAREGFVGVREVENANAMESLLAEMWRQIGDQGKSWYWHGRALANLHRLHKSRRIQNVLDAVADQLQEQGRLELARYFVDAWVAEAERSGNAVSRSLALSERARIWSGLGRMEAAGTDVGRALGALEEIPATGLRLVTRGDVLLTLAQVYQESGDLAAALWALDEVLSLASTGASRKTVEALEHRSLLHRIRGDEERALDDLRLAAAEVRRQRRLLDDPWERIHYLDQARRVQEKLVSLLADNGEWEAAFWLADDLRAPEVREALAARTPAADFPVPRLRRGTAVLAYLTLPERLLIWRWDGNGLRGRSVAVSRQALGDAVEEIWKELRRGEVAGDEALRLGNLLLPALATTAVEDLVLVPDGPLHGLPFGALASPDGDLLLDQARIVVTPSLAVSRLLEAESSPAPPSSSLLLVTDVDFSTTHFPSLARLEPASTELRGGLPEPSRMLLGTNATPERFLREFPRHRTVVFSGHSVVPGPASRRAGLVLAPGGPGEDGLLTPEDLRRASPGITRLVVLASCSGAAGPTSLSEGPLSLVRPFLAQGVPAVVASLRPVESRSTESLMAALFGAGTEEPIDGLRKAQLAVLDAGSSGLTTAMAFQAYGSTEGRILWRESSADESHPVGRVHVSTQEREVLDGGGDH